MFPIFVSLDLLERFIFFYLQVDFTFNRSLFGFLNLRNAIFQQLRKTSQPFSLQLLPCHFLLPSTIPISCSLVLLLLLQMSLSSYFLCLCLHNFFGSLFQSINSALSSLLFKPSIFKKNYSAFIYRSLDGFFSKSPWSNCLCDVKYSEMQILFNVIPG